MRVSSSYHAFLLVGLCSSFRGGALAFAPSTTSSRLTFSQQLHPRQSLLRAATPSPLGRRTSASSSPKQQRHEPSHFIILHAVHNNEDDDATKDNTASSSSSPNSSTSHDNISSNTHLPFDDYLDQVQLGQAVSYLKQHPDTPLNDRSRWNRIFQAIEERTRQATQEEEDLMRKNALKLQQRQPPQDFPVESVARQEMTDMYDTLRELQHLKLFGAVPITAPPVAGSHAVSPEMLEHILNIPMIALTPQPTNTLLLAGVILALVEVAVSVATGMNLNTLVLATLVASFMDRLFLNGAILESTLKVLSPGVQDKILRHEAGHFLAAYLLGCPVEGIVLSAWSALQDKRFGSRHVSAGTSFYDPELSRQINSSAASATNSRGNGDTKQPTSSLTRSSIDRYSIIVMAGIAAEADTYGRADGGAGDELALIGFLSRLTGGDDARSNNAVPAWDAAAIKNQARWGAMQAVLMFREYQPAYDALVQVLEKGGSTLGDCIYAIEEAAREHNLQPLGQPIGYLKERANGGVLWRATTRETAVDDEANGDRLPPPFVMNGEESLATLKEYRAVVEKRLEELDEQLDKLR